jgi:hypothetical protein
MTPIPRGTQSHGRCIELPQYWELKKIISFA